MKTLVSQLPALDSGLECSEAAQIHLHACFLLLFSLCAIGVLSRAQATRI